MSKTLFRFVKQVASLAQKLTDAALVEISDPAGNGFAGWKHAVLIYQKFHMDATYEEMDRIRLLLSLSRGAFPHHTTLCKAYKRTSMQVWRQ